MSLKLATTLHVTREVMDHCMSLEFE